MFLLALLSATAGVAQASDMPTAQTEMLAFSVPDEFDVGHQARNDAVLLVELVEPPETVANWSKLITSLMFFNAANRGLGPFYAQWRDQLRGSCPGMTDRVVQGNVDAMPALRAAIYCPANPQTGRVENLEAVLVQGRANMMMVQVAFRRPAMPADSALVERVTASMKVCDQRALSLCSARTATGFVQAGQTAR